MNWEIVGSTGEWAGALAVVVTLFYLARQTKQTNAISKSSKHDELIKQFFDLNRLVVRDTALRGALYSREDHSEDQLNQVYAFAILKCNNWIAVEAAYVDGRLETDLYEAVKKDVRVTIEMWPVIKQAIDQWRATYPEVASRPIFDYV